MVPGNRVFYRIAKVAKTGVVAQLQRSRPLTHQTSRQTRFSDSDGAILQPLFKRRTDAEMDERWDSGGGEESPLIPRRGTF